MDHEKFRKCIQLCVSCGIECSNCAAACLNEKDFETLIHCIQMNRDCAALCQVAVSAMTDDNPIAGEICDVCADMCDKCAEECERHDLDHCKRCAEICRECAVECRNVMVPETIV
jgi:hypothetical protein